MAERDDLLKICESLNLNPEKSKNRVNKETGEKYKESTIKDCRKAIQNYYIEKYRQEGTLSPFILKIMKLDSPMLALQIKDKKLDKIRDLIWEDNNNWIFQEKIDGARCIVCYDINYGWDFYSRNPSVIDQLPTSYRTKLIVPPLNNDILMRYGINNFIIDTELVPLNKKINTMQDGTELVADTQLNLVTSILGSLDDLSHKMQETNPIKFMAFDVLEINNTWFADSINPDTGDLIKGPSLKNRYSELLKLYSIIKAAGLNDRINLVSSTMSNKHQFYDTILSMGGEGVVAKDLTSSYDIKGKRAGEWVKCKRSISQSIMMEKIGDTIDAFITGFKEGNVGTSNEGLIGALEFSVYLTNDENDYLYDEEGNPILHHIATVSGIPQELREAISSKDEYGNIKLRQDMYGKVATIDGQDISSKNMRFAHAVLKGWRPDRDAMSCKMQKSFLERMIL